jgi:glycosyltransferase involved in cell wall biosynthesis
LADRLQRLGVRLFPWELHDRGGRRWPPEICRRRMAQVITAANPALIHANSLSMSRLAGPVALELRLPSIGHLRDIVRVNRQTLVDLAAHPRLLAVSAATRDWYVPLGLPPDRIRVLHNGVDLVEFRPRPPTGCLHRELGLPPDAVLVGGVGQIGLRKGWDVLAHAAVRVSAAVPNVHFTLVGQRHSQKQESVDYESELRRVAGTPPLAGRFHFLGRRDDVPRLLNEWAVLVHPARQEPLGRVLLEAAASGLAVVATAVGGTPEIFPESGLAAELVPPDNPQALAAALEKTLGDARLRERLGAAARRRAEEAFDARAAAAGLVRHYTEVLTC